MFITFSFEPTPILFRSPKKFLYGRISHIQRFFLLRPLQMEIDDVDKVVRA